jgi:DNA-binding transcriptional regulator YdaS (Cro superfamily)
MDKPIERAVTALGGQTALARAIGVTQGLVWQWARQGRLIPVARAISIEEATAGRVRVEDLRPDVTWHRDESGAVTGYIIPVTTTAPTEKVA